MGRSLGDVTKFYEQNELERYLSEDAAKLEAFVRAGERETLKFEATKREKFICFPRHAI
jgi:hypothetical protein